MILRQFRTAFLMLAVLTVLTGLVYPGVVTGIAQVVFPDQADGSFVERDGQTVGSELLGQGFVDAETNQTIAGYFRGRPSAATITDDGLIISGGSNLGPTNQLLADRVSADVATIRAENGLAADATIPVDLVTASGSGVDPDISPASADLQVARVARERGISEDQVRELIDEHTAGRILWFLGEERVNVLALNLALDEVSPLPQAASPGA